jgi:predicted dehydrogenase
MGLRHAAALTELEGCEYVGAADHGAPRRALDRPVVPELADLLALGMDACVVATPAPDHAHTAAVLAEAGIATLVEKPLATTVEECALLEAAFATAGVPAAVGHVERFHPAVRALRLALTDGNVGPVVRVVSRREGGPPRRRDGGVLLDLGTHDFDLTRWLTGQSHDQVRARSADPVPGSDSVEVEATLSGGIEAAHRVSWCSPERARTFEVHCAGGVLLADTTDPGAAPPVPAQLQAFRDLVLGRQEHDGRDGCATLADGAYAVAVAVRAAAALLR